MSDLNPFTFASPKTETETISHANANAYEWAYLDTCRENGVNPTRIPDGWAYAWLEYVRRNPSSRMAIREGFQTWRDTGTLPGLATEEGK